MIRFQIIHTGESFRVVPIVFILHDAELNLLIQQRHCCCICEAGDEDWFRLCLWLRWKRTTGKTQQECSYLQLHQGLCRAQRECTLHKTGHPSNLEKYFFPLPLMLNIRPELFMQVPQCIFNHETNWTVNRAAVIIICWSWEYILYSSMHFNPNCNCSFFRKWLA